MAKTKSSPLLLGSLFGVALFNLASAIFAVIHFQKLGVWNVSIAAFLFLTFGTLVSWTIIKPKLSIPELKFRPASIFLGVVWFAYMWVLSFPIEHLSTKIYFPDFPVASLDHGAKVMQDTLFNSALIQSIMSFGYPSTAISSVPFTQYHVLTHYFEAAVFKVAGLGALESAGLLFRLTIVATLTVVSAFVLRFLGSRTLRSNLIGLLLVVPALLSGWHIVYSQPLWLTSILAVPFSIYSFSCIRNSQIKVSSLWLIALFTVVLALGKVSTGLIFGVFIFGILILKNYKNKNVWTVGVATSIALMGYAVFIASDRTIGASASATFSKAGLVPFISSGDPGLLSASAILILAIVLFLVFKDLLVLRLAMITGLNILAVLALAAIQQNPSDLYYFLQATFFVAALLLVQSFDEFTNQGKAAIKVLKFGRLTGLCLAALFALLLVERVPLDVFSFNPKLVSQTVNAAFKNPRYPATSNLSFSEFNSELKEYLDRHELSADKTRLVLTQQQFDAFLVGYQAQPWSLPIAIYAVTGVPLQNGVTEIASSYGFSKYTENDLALTENNIKSTLVCSSDLTYIKLNSTDPFSFSQICD